MITAVSSHDVSEQNAICAQINRYRIPKRMGLIKRVTTWWNLSEELARAARNTVGHAYYNDHRAVIKMEIERTVSAVIRGFDRGAVTSMFLTKLREMKGEVVKQSLTAEEIATWGAK